ncbi:MAG: AraC family transcriptional regulator [Clostridium sp.]
MTQEYSDEITFNLISSKQNYVGDFSNRERTDVFYLAISVNGARYAKKQAGYHLLVDTYLIQLLFFVNNLFCSSVSAQTLQGEPIVKEIMEYIRTHLQEEISLTSLSDALSLSKYHLCHIFKEQTGTTIYNHFITTFKKLTGFTPKKYASLFR